MLITTDEVNQSTTKMERHIYHVHGLEDSTK